MGVPCPFQFLIGRLETGAAIVLRMAAAAFQFLIGRLETILGRGSSVAGNVFQFLIGRLETPAPGEPPPGPGDVSIPHR